MIDMSSVIPVVTGIGGALIGAWAGIRKSSAEAETTLGDGWAKLVADLRQEMGRREKSCNERIAALETWQRVAQKELDDCRKHTRASRTIGPAETRA